MITWGQKPNTNPQSLQSLGAIATGNTHVFTRYRSLADGAALHSLQRTGDVSSASHQGMVRMATFSRGGIGDGPPAAYHNAALPPVVKVGTVGTSLDPAMRV